VRPPNQRFDPDDVTGAQVELRLVEHRQIAVVDGVSQFAEQPHRRTTFGGARLRRQLDLVRIGESHVGGEGVQAPGFRPFRRVHGHIGLFEQQICGQVRVGRRRHGQSDAGPHQQLLSVDDEGFLERGHHAMGDQPRQFRQALHQHGEFVTTDTGHGVRGPYAAEKPFGGLNEQGIACGMTQAVVDQLEVVEIHRQHRHGLVVILVQLHRVHEPVVEQVTVRQTGEGIAHRLLGDHPQQPLVLPHHHVLPRHHRAHQQCRRHEDRSEAGGPEVRRDAHHGGEGDGNVGQPHRDP
jgi:hypothetical protein